MKYVYSDSSKHGVVILDASDNQVSWVAASTLPDDAIIEPYVPIPEPTPIDPVEKLRAFLAANPDVQEILG